MIDLATLKTLYNNNEIRIVDIDLDDDNYIQIDVHFPKGENEDFIEFYEIYTIHLWDKSMQSHRYTPNEYANLIR